VASWIGWIAYAWQYPIVPILNLATCVLKSNDHTTYKSGKPVGMASNTSVNSCMLWTVSKSNNTKWTQRNIPCEALEITATRVKENIPFAFSESEDLIESSMFWDGPSTESVWRISEIRASMNMLITVLMS